jgi:predicted acylesterase/phospholipase RssA
MHTSVFSKCWEGLGFRLAIAGTSAGSIFGAMYAGRTIEEMTTFAVNVQRQYNFSPGLDTGIFWLPRSGLIKGK